MSEDPLALYSITSTMPSSDPSVLPSESDYEAICAAVMETLRGRWFLAEYARRNRHSDTKVVLSAIERIEAMIRGDSVATPADRFRIELADMAKAIARTKSEIAAIKPEAEQPGKILEASEELDSIVHATEKATSDILAAAEQVQEIAWTVREQDLAAPICDQLDGLATDIYTACSFQDLTGQRIQKVIYAMRYLEERINTMIDIWDDGASAQAGSTSAAAAAAAEAPHPAHHDVAQDDLDQTDVDMVMDPAQAEAAIKAEPDAGRVTIDHEPLQPAALDPTPEAEKFAPEGLVPESLARVSLAASDETGEVPLFFRAMEPSGPVAEAVPIEDGHTPAADATSAQATAPETAAKPEMDLAPTIAAVREALFGAFPGLAERRDDDAEEAAMPAPVGDDEPAAELFEPAPAIAGQSVAEQIMSDPAVLDQLVSDQVVSDQGMAAEPQSEIASAAEPVADEIEGRATPTLVGPADFLLEPLPPPALRARETVAPFSEPEPDTAEVAETSEPALADAIAEPLTAHAASFDASMAEAAPEPVQSIAETSKPEAAVEPIAEIPEAETAAVAGIEPVESAEAVATFERETAVIEAVSSEPIEAIDEPAQPETAFEAASHKAEAAEIEPAPIDIAGVQTSEIEIIEIEIAESEIVTVEAVESEIDAAAIEVVEAEAPAHLTAELEATEPEITAPEVAEPEAAEPEQAATEVPTEAIELDIVEIAEIEAVATAPVAPEPVAEAVEAGVQAKVEEPEPVKADTEAKEEAEDEERPVARTAMPEVTFASMAPILMPMEATRAEPAGERFAAAATATPTQGDFIPFGHVAAQPAVSPRPVAVAAPSIYSTSPYLESSRPGAAHVTQADPLAAITALTDDEKIALFS
jgi:chemotaxis protein CheZ